VEFYFSDRVYLRYHFLAVCEKANRYNVLRGIGVGEQLLSSLPTIISGAAPAEHREVIVKTTAKPKLHWIDDADAILASCTTLFCEVS
jgi:hypothetical protein